jgi:hypothetical protein
MRQGHDPEGAMFFYGKCGGRVACFVRLLYGFSLVETFSTVDKGS